MRTIVPLGAYFVTYHNNYFDLHNQISNILFVLVKKINHDLEHIIEREKKHSIIHSKEKIIFPEFSRCSLCKQINKK